MAYFSFDESQLYAVADPPADQLRASIASINREIAQQPSVRAKFVERADEERRLMDATYVERADCERDYSHLKRLAGIAVRLRNAYSRILSESETFATRWGHRLTEELVPLTLLRYGGTNG